MADKGRKKEGSDLLASEEKFRSFVRGSLDGIVIIDDQGTILEWNEGEERITGIPRAEAIGRPMWEVQNRLVPEDRKDPASLQIAREKIFNGLKEGAALKRDLEDEISRPDGMKRIVQSMLFGMRCGEGIQACAISRDVTDRKKVERDLAEKEESLRKLSDNLPDGLVYQIDSGEDGQRRKFTYISKGVEQLHGVTAAEALSDPWVIYGQVVEKDRTMIAEREAAALASMTPLIVEAQVRLASGEVRWRRFASSPRRLTDRRIVWDGIEIDITERKRAEEEIRNYQLNLEGMVEQRTRELQEAQEKLARNERLAALGKFAGALSHELRNPISVILNSVSYLMMPGLQTDHTEVTEMLHVIKRQIEIAAMIVGNTLDFANPTKLELKKGRIDRDIENALALITIPEGIVVEKDFNSGREICADHNLVELVFVNLIKNSIQACKAAGAIHMRTSDDNRHVKVVIEDTGGGIDPEDMKNLFEPLFSRKPQGIGLGLYIVKGIIDRHKGNIRIDNTFGKGVVVTVLLPADGTEPLNQIGYV